MDRLLMVDLAARHEQASSRVEALVLEVLRGGGYVGGALVAEVEAVAARRFGRAGAVGVASGTDALMLGLQALGLRPGDEVILPALSFFATAGAVAALGLVPVIADVREDGLLDPDAARRAWTPRTRAVIPVHLFGSAAPDPGLGVPVLDDAAQAVGAGVRCAYGALSATSVYPTKTWGAAGDGGFVLGDDPALLARVRALGNHGYLDGQHRQVSGWVGRNARLDPIQAAVLLGQEPELDQRIARRQAIARRYDRELPRSVRPLSRDPDSPVHQYAVLVEDRALVQARLSTLGVETRAYYARPLHQEPAVAQGAEAPVAEHLAARLLALPVRASLSDAEVDRVLDALRQAVRG
ncbi:MAG: DegT/DnrJ/EryC1/StrS family aminotransferase [Deltaproteobacteria bacterium]|nr:DegT/DnrJ/EryC1/StrS family aminotransferase [Deltaproteobacteria bacterium]